MARLCAFCGKNDVTKEHLFARWVRDEYEDHRVAGPSAMDFVRDAETVWSYSGDTLEQGVKAFCATCNNDWMSALEVRAGKILRPMLRGKVTGPVTMRYAEQTTVASWATKTAFVLQQIHPADSRIPESYYRAFHRKKEPSSDVFVTMGARKVAGDNKGLNLFEYMERFLGKQSSGIQHIHFALGFIYFGITIFIGRPRCFPKWMNDEVGLRINLIWPCQPAVGWPTPPIDDVGGLKGMYEGFTSAVWRDR